MLDAVRPLVAHMEWADAMVWRAVDDCAAASDDKILHDRLYHIHATQTGFLQAWRGEEVVFSGPDDYPGLASVRKLGRDFYAVATGYVASLAPGDVERVMVLPWSSYFAKRAGITADRSTRESASSAERRRWSTSSPGSGQENRRRSGDV
jgi:hypothetical protein